MCVCLLICLSVFGACGMRGVGASPAHFLEVIRKVMGTCHLESRMGLYELAVRLRRGTTSVGTNLVIPGIRSGSGRAREVNEIGKPPSASPLSPQTTPGRIPPCNADSLGLCTKRALWGATASEAAMPTNGQRPEQAPSRCRCDLSDASTSSRPPLAGTRGSTVPESSCSRRDKSVRSDYV